MPFVRKSSQYRVTFEDPNPLAGLQIVTKGLSVKEFAEFGMRMADIGKLDQVGTEAQKLDQLRGVVGALGEVKAKFAEALIEWDMTEEDGSPTPATLAGVEMLDDDLFFALVNEWLTAIGGPSPDLGKDSGHGESIPDLSALMEPLPPSLLS